MYKSPYYRLIISHKAWESAVRTLLHEADQYAMGILRWNSGINQVEFLVNQLEIQKQLFTGQDHLPLSYHLILSIRSSETTATQILSQFSPRTSQTIVIVTMHQNNRNRWEGIVHRNGVCFPLDELRVIGPGMLRVDREEQLEQQVHPQTGQWSRTIGALGPHLWQQVSQSHVLIIGCGRNGTLAAWQFTGLGIQQLTLVDPDHLELENLEAMPGLTREDVGQLKATALAKRLVASNPDIMLRCITEPVTDALHQLRSRFDLIVTCVDSDTPRLAASWLSREILIPHLDIGTSVQRVGEETTLSGDIRLLLPFQGCVSCVGGISNRADVLYEFAAPPGSMHRGEPVSWHEQRAGSLVHLNSITVGTAIEIWLSFLQRNIGSFWQRLAWNHTGGLEANAAAVGGNTSCEFCFPN